MGTAGGVCRGGLTSFLCCAWAVSLLYGEMIAFFTTSNSCSWPSSSSDSFSPLQSNRTAHLNVAVLTDPQLMDRTSLPRLSPGSFLSEAAQFYTDLYMRRAFRSSVLPFHPHLILFLGDNFDGGFLLTDNEWQQSLNRFRHIFTLTEPNNVPVYHLSGNHDIGYAGLHSLQPEVITRFEREFGSRNYKFSAGKVEFVAIDAQTLDGPKKALYTSSSWSFVGNISKNGPTCPRILLTHIPLYRPDGSPCGPLRTSPVINQRVSRFGPHQGIKYQNYLSKETSDILLNLIKPVLVLSGHDHDQCTIMHSTPDGPVKEQTLGTVSWQQGNLYPSFMLLSASFPISSDATDQGVEVATHVCFLPMQTHIYIWYLTLFLLSLFLLIIWPKNGFPISSHIISFIGTARSNLFRTTKEKDEEANYEFEMVWDAEGSMHLVKKMPTMGSDVKSDRGIVGRGNVVARPTAKRQAEQDQQLESSFMLEMGADIKSEGAGRFGVSNRSTSRAIILRLIRIVRAVMVIAAVNIPLYIMLLFKDWV